jgi:GH15 family glucan-1,4-alpha-glucosidase
VARSVILGNSGLTVGLDESGLVHDFYYPYVGLENLTTSRMNTHHVGLWVDGVFRWLHDVSWESHVDFSDKALVSSIIKISKELNVELHFQDFVDANHDIFARKIMIVNKSDTLRDIRMFFHQNFQISALGRADTAMYVPDGHYMLDYKGRCSLLAYAETISGTPFDQYAAGNAGIEGKEGTYRDAEDGELSMSAVEHGGVDSTIRVRTEIGPQSSETIHYWLAIADSQQRLEMLHELMLDNGFDRRLQATRQHWHDWLSVSEQRLSSLPDKYAKAVRKSLMVIKAHTDEHGGIIASCDSSIYNYGRDYYSYVWPRDGAYVMWPLIQLGYVYEPRAFFHFCANIISPDGYLMHKYQPDRAIGSTWHPLVHGKRKELAIQEDETAIVIFMIAEYYRETEDKKLVEDVMQSLILPAGDFMARFIDKELGLAHASYDLWEEKFLSNTYTNAITYKALLDALWLVEACGINHPNLNKWKETAKSLVHGAPMFFDQQKNSLIKGFLFSEGTCKIDPVLDVSSFYGGWKFGYIPDEFTKLTLQNIEKKLLDVSPSGGSPRYEHDNYFRSEPAHMGNPWFVTTLWLAQYYAENGEKERAKHYIDWALKHSLPSGVLSEQITPEDGKIVGVTPLVWSHAELIRAILCLN